MSIYGNIYVKENRECKLVINDVVGTDFALVEISFNGMFTRYRNVSFLINSHDVYKFAKLLAMPVEGKGSEGMDNYYNNKINSYEYMHYTLCLSDDALAKKLKEIQSENFKSTDTKDLVDFKKRLATDLNNIDKILKERGELKLWE